MRNTWLLHRSQKGQGTVEYALITLAVVAIIVVVLFSGGGLSQAIRDAFDRATASIGQGTAENAAPGGDAGGGAAGGGAG